MAGDMHAKATPSRFIWAVSIAHSSCHMYKRPLIHAFMLVWCTAAEI